MDHSGGVSKSGPNKTLNFEMEPIWSISSQAILAQTKMDIIQCVVVRCPKVCISCENVQIPFLLDSVTKVSLVRQSYFDKVLLSIVNSSSSVKVEAHS